MKNFSGLVFCVIAAFLLTSCAETNTHFSCDKVGGKGVGCVSLATANGMVDKGYFNNTDKPLSISTKASATISDLTFSESNVDWRPRAGMPLRFGESVQNIWIAPFVDLEGNYHWPQMESIVIAAGHWVGAPQSEIAMSGDNDD